MWKPDNPEERSWIFWSNASCFRYLLRELWQKADTEPITFISIDSEYDGTKICELGLTVQAKDEEPNRRNIIVSANNRRKASKKKQFGFGKSEYVNKSSDLFPILFKLFLDQRKLGRRVVLPGFDIGNDLKCLDLDARWRPSEDVTVLDVQCICKTFMLRSKCVRLGNAVEEFNIGVGKDAPRHNAGNDFW